MITAVDTNILLDVFLPDPVHGTVSANRLKQYSGKGALIVCEIVYAELACAFPSKKELEKALKIVGIELIRSNEETLWLSAEIWKRALSKIKRTHRILPDFLVGAHALNQADGLLTRDRGFYSGYFKSLKIAE